MTADGKKKKSKTESFGKKVRTTKKKTSKEKDKKHRSHKLEDLDPSFIPIMPPDDDDSDENGEDTPDDFSPPPGLSGIKPIGGGGGKDDGPSFLLIPLLDSVKRGGLGGSGPDEEGISVDTNFTFPLSGRRKRSAGLKIDTRKKSPVSLRLNKAREEIEKYNMEAGNDLKRHSLREQLLLMDMEISAKAMILRKFEDNERSRNSFDQSKFTNWIKDILQLPFGKRIPLPIQLKDGPAKIKEYLEKSRKHLDTAIAGQENAKEEVVDFIARLISNPQARGSILALFGPKGSGKTKLIRKGVAEALGRPFHVINLGGMNDSHVLTGHDLTYTGSRYGRLAQILIQSHCENPVIYLDEIDKIQSGSDKGMEIFRVLTHILDQEQNHEFLDEYFGGVKIDLSRVLFVASLNDPEAVDPILRDRLKLIEVKPLDLETKLDIVYNYIVPEMCTEIGMAKTGLHIPTDVAKYIIQNKTEQEDGCRQLKQRLETIIQKLNTQRITCTGIYQSDDTVVDVGEERVVTLSNDLVDKLLKNTESKGNYPAHMYT